MPDLRFTVSGAALSSLANANTATRGYDHTLSGGDLHQMGCWSRHLRAKGMDVGNRDVYPAFRTREELERAIRLLWEGQVEGWWNLRQEIMALGIATAEECSEQLRIRVEMARCSGR